MLLKFLLAGMENAQQSQQLALQKEQLKQRQKEFDLEQQQQTYLGEAIRPALVQSEQATVPLPDLGSIFGMLGGTPVQAITPLGQTAQRAPAAVIPQLEEQTRGLRQEAAKDRGLQRALAGTPPEHRKAVETLATYERIGVELPLGAKQTLFPDLFPSGVDPQVANAALRYGLTGEMTWGQIERLFPSIPSGIFPKDFKFTPILGGQRQTELQSKASMYLEQMTLSNQVLDDLEAQGVTISIPAQLQRELRVRASGQGVFNLAASLGDMVLNLGLPPEQKQLINAMLRGGNAFRYQMSGQQTSDREFVSILSYYVESVGDDPVTRAQKKAFRLAVMEATRSVAQGGKSRVRAMDDILSLSQNLPADVQATLQNMRRYAEKEDRQPSQPVLTRDPVNPASSAADDQIRALIDQIDQGQRRQMLWGTP